MTPLLQGKNAIIYGAGGSIGSAVARTFAAEGAAVFLAGRTREPLERVADDIASTGGRAEVSVVDATDERAVDEHADGVAARAGSIDVSFNLVFRGDAQGTPIVDMRLQDFLHALTVGTTTAFLTARAAARHMIDKGSGTILHLTSGSARGSAPGMGNTGPTDAATDTLMRYLAMELGPAGIRVVGIHTAGVRGTLDPDILRAVNPDVEPDPDAIYAAIGANAMLGRVADLREVADTAAFLASDRAGAITSQMVNVTCGLIPG